MSESHAARSSGESGGELGGEPGPKSQAPARAEPGAVDYRDLHRLAFQALFQLDAHAAKGPSPERAGEATAAEAGLLLDALASEDGAQGERLQQAFMLAQRAYAQRASADEAMAKLAPTWPAHRQAAVDRAILRLAHHAIVNRLAPGKAVINHAVALAKEFSTEKSPSFINALLDKVYKEGQRE